MRQSCEKPVSRMRVLLQIPAEVWLRENEDACCVMCHGQVQKVVIPDVSFLHITVSNILSGHLDFEE